MWQGGWLGTTRRVWTRGEQWWQQWGGGTGHIEEGAEEARRRANAAAERGDMVPTVWFSRGHRPAQPWSAHSEGIHDE